MPPQARAAALAFYQHTPLTGEQVAELVGASSPTVHRWWQVYDRENGKPPHRGTSGQSPQDVVARLQVERDEARAQVVELTARVAAAQEVQSEVDALLSEVKLALRSAIALAKPEAMASVANAAINLHRYLKEIGGDVDKEERARWLREEINRRLLEIQRPPDRPGTIDTGEVPDVSPTDPGEVPFEDDPPADNGLAVPSVEEDGAPF